MASRRSLLRLTARCMTRTALRQSTFMSRTVAPCGPQSHLAPRCLAVNKQQLRWHSAPPSKSKVYDFDMIQSLVQSPTNDQILIDVREPHEYTAGFIPTAINIPIQSQPDALFLAPDEFEDKFGFQKPPPGKELVFYCKAGVRSSAAAQLALQHGYEKVGEYRGSWLDWEKHGGMSSKMATGDQGGEIKV